MSASKATAYSVQVQWGDCDPAGIVFFPHYFRWCDEATWHLLRQRGLTRQRIVEEFGATALPLVHAEADFAAPCGQGDVLLVDSRVESLGTRSLRISHAFRRADDGRHVLRGLCVHVWACVDPLHKAVAAQPLPDAVRALLQGGAEGGASPC